jgi:epoxyqueuosine reductase QueG
MVSSPKSIDVESPTQLGLDPALSAAGLNVAASLAIGEYDALVPASWKSQELLPNASSVIVLGSGGDRFYWTARQARPGSQHPVDEHCEALVTHAAERLSAAGFTAYPAFYWERKAQDRGKPGEFADFVALARAAGLGETSRLGLLLHPRYGPWFAIRALLLSERPTPAAVNLGVEAADRYDPCPSCSAPCVAACPGNAVSHSDVFFAERCAQTRHELAGCANRCAARLACPEGEEYRYAAEALSHHMTSHFRTGET